MFGWVLKKRQSMSERALRAGKHEKAGGEYGRHPSQISVQPGKPMESQNVICKCETCTTSQVFA